jgi:hypothetical protein
LRERSIELAFEGHRYWDVVRYIKATSEFSVPIKGFNPSGTDFETFFKPITVDFRIFSTSNYLWPIPLNELNVNANLVQNPGW